MKALLQRVTRATVNVKDEQIGSIGQGLLVFLCSEKGDEPADLDYLVKKVAQLRIFADAEDKMNLDLQQTGGEILVVSQFTLAADLRRGNRPDFSAAETPAKAEAACAQFAEALRRRGLTVREGSFGATMQVSLTNHGPVTIWLDSRERRSPRS